MTPHSQLETHNSKLNIAVFASGAGSNAEQIIRYFKDAPTARADEWSPEYKAALRRRTLDRGARRGAHLTH